MRPLTEDAVVDRHWEESRNLSPVTEKNFIERKEILSGMKCHEQSRRVSKEGGWNEY